MKQKVLDKKSKDGKTGKEGEKNLTEKSGIKMERKKGYKYKK
jgi:hypothetical protein